MSFVGASGAELEYRNLGRDTFSTINIYELAHKCKEWLVSKGYSLHITYKQSIVTIDCMNKMLLDNISEFGKLNDEITPLIKICQFIYNKELKNDEV